MTTTTETTFRIVNTADHIGGPHGLHYMHDGSRPFAVLRGTGKREICVGRYSQEASAKRAIRDRVAKSAA